MAYIKEGLHDAGAFARQWGDKPELPVLEQWDINREMCFRIAWKPYMYNRTLKPLLGGVSTPAKVVWGAEDRIVPASTAKIWAEALPNAELEMLPACGHFAEIEQGDQLAKRLIPFLSA
jgi:pimeloyl-ACP methyl ester carboxylesterase